MNRPFFALAAVAATILLPGCSCIQEIGGAYFPAWMLSILIGWVLALIVRLILIKVGIDGWIRPRSIGYPALNVFFTLLIYLIFFTH
ncbi:MAG: YtcA family lipoprotein [bacterium]